MAVSNRLRYEVFSRDRFTCRYCGAYAPYAVLEVDHIEAKSRGGKDVLENLVTACRTCNSGKSDAVPPSWLPAAIEQETRRWLDQPQEADEEDLAEMERYQEALYVLTALSAGEALHWVARAYIAAMPYRPTHSELIIAAGGMARRAADKRHEPYTPGRF